MIGGFLMKKFLSLLLVNCIALSFGGATALAKNDQNVFTVSMFSTNGTSTTISGNAHAGRTSSTPDIYTAVRSAAITKSAKSPTLKDSIDIILGTKIEASGSSEAMSKAAAMAADDSIRESVEVVVAGDELDVFVGGEEPAEDSPITVENTTVTIGADIVVESEDTTALSVTTGGDNAAVNVVTADVSAGSEDNSAGSNSAAISADAVEGGKIEISAGDVVNHDDAGIQAQADFGGSVSVKAESVEADGTAVDINSYESGKVEVTVGSAEGTGESDGPAVISEAGSGIFASSSGGTSAATVNGDVEARSDGITVSVSDGTETGSAIVTVIVEGSVTAGVTAEADEPEELGVGEGSEGVERNAINVNNTAGTASITVNGDAESESTGIKVIGEGTTDITVDGTLNVGENGTAVLIGEGVTEDNLTITVWKIGVDGKQPEKGDIVRPADEDGSLIAQGEVSAEDAARAQAIENSINYIIRIDPAQSGSLSSDQDTAKANETVKITVKIPDGHTLKAVYTDEGETLTAQDNGDGTFTVTVPAGGGVYVHADFAEIPEPEPKPEPEPEPEPEPGPKPVPNPSPIYSGDSTQGGTTPNTVLVKDGTATYDLGKGDLKITLLAQTLKTLVKSRSITEFVFKMNGKTYTVKAEDLLAWLASSPSVTLYADGDRLVLDFGNGEIVVLESDEAAAAESSKNTTADTAKVDKNTSSGTSGPKGVTANVSNTTSKPVTIDGDGEDTLSGTSSSSTAVNAGKINMNAASFTAGVNTAADKTPIVPIHEAPSKTIPRDRPDAPSTPTKHKPTTPKPPNASGDSGNPANTEDLDSKVSYEDAYNAAIDAGHPETWAANYATARAAGHTDEGAEAYADQIEAGHTDGAEACANVIDQLVKDFINDPGNREYYISKFMMDYNDCLEVFEDELTAVEVAFSELFPSGI